MTTLRLILDDMLLRGGGPLARYAEELARAIVRAAPRGADVAGIVAAAFEDDYARVRERVPGLRELHEAALARRELAAAWQRGFTTLPGSGVVHATSLFAPLRRHDRSLNPGDQIVVTIHDAVAWTHPELLPSRQASWTTSMGRRAEKHADAIVVPTHAVAADLEEHLDLAGRVRVIGSAPASDLAVPADAAARRASHELPERYVVAVAEGDARNGFADLAAAAARLDVPVVLLVGPGDSAVLDDPSGLTLVEEPDWSDRIAILGGATAFVSPALAAGPASVLLDALALGLPIVATDLPAVSELTDDAAVLVPPGDPEALADAVRSLLDDATALDRAAVASGDRAKAFTWRDAAEKVWQLHADL
jgi:glycosyltransferase involved in cell wall biosynthesis